MIAVVTHFSGDISSTSSNDIDGVKRPQPCLFLLCDGAAEARRASGGVTAARFATGGDVRSFATCCLKSASAIARDAFGIRGRPDGRTSGVSPCYQLSWRRKAYDSAAEASEAMFMKVGKAIYVARKCARVIQAASQRYRLSLYITNKSRYSPR